MTQSEAQIVRDLKIKQGFSWGGIAEECWVRFPWAFWSPPNNQAVGMALCESAAGFFEGENWRKMPWS